MNPLDKYVEKPVASRTEGLRSVANLRAKDLLPENAGDTAKTAYKSVTQPILVALSDAWIGIGLAHPATTEKPLGSFSLKQEQQVESQTPMLDRFDYTKLWSLQLGDYFLPLSQTFTLRARKRLNVSSLVDGIDIIQQTRKEAKTVDCSIRLSLRENQDNLQLVKANSEVVRLASFLTDFYESDTVLAIKNEMINDTFGVQHVIISEYRFLPRTGMGTYTLEFSLTEVLYGENVLTFNLREIDADAGLRKPSQG